MDYARALEAELIKAMWTSVGNGEDNAADEKKVNGKPKGLLDLFGKK